MKSKIKILSFVIPAYNEEEVIPELIKRLTLFINQYSQYAFEIIIVENGSVDKSFSLLSQYAKKDKRIKIVQLSRNFGGDEGILAGMRFATGDAAIIFMADLQEPLETVKQFIIKWEEGYEIVYGIVKKRTAGLWRSLTSRLFYRILNIFARNSFPENASDFRLVDRSVYHVLNNMKEQNKYLRGLVYWTGFKQIGIPFDRLPRYRGKSKAQFWGFFTVAFNAIFSFSYLPLRLVSFFGILITLFSFVTIIFYIINFLVKGSVAPGTNTIITVMLFMFGVLFFVLGIISEYLLRIYDEVKGRPNFIIRKVINL